MLGAVDTIDVKNVFYVFYYFFYKKRIFNGFYFLKVFFYFLLDKIFNPAKPAKLLHKTTFRQGIF